MKRLYSLLTAVILTVSVFAQIPEKMSYQAVVRDASNALVTNHEVSMQISILQGSVSGPAVYVETQTPVTNVNGLISIEIGSGTVVSGVFNKVDWSNGPYFIKTETDPSGGAAYSITGTSQLMSVPYALYAKEAQNAFSGNYDDLINQPSIPMNTSDLNNDAGFITSPNDADADSLNEIELPAEANQWDVLEYDGTDWVAADKSMVVHAELSEALTTIATVGGLQFRYGSTTTGGSIQVRTVSDSKHLQVFATKKHATLTPGGGVSENYYNDENYSTSWSNILTLWDGEAWSIPVNIQNYEAFEGYMFELGNEPGHLPGKFIYHFFAAIDGYNQILIRVNIEKVDN